MTTIPLSNGNGLVAIVDDEDFERVSRNTWRLTRTGYVSTFFSKKHKLLHRTIMEITDRSIKIDHINGNKLDNRKENLRQATTSQNAWNAGVTKKSSSGYRGAYLCKATNHWRSDLMVNGKRMSLGNYATAEEAAKARDKKALELQGEFARLNFPDFDYTNYEPKPLNVGKLTSTTRGVYWCKYFQMWKAGFHVNKKFIYVGSFDTQEEAAKAINAKRAEVGYKQFRRNEYTDKELNKREDNPQK